jgi:hypothetical protein
VVGGVATGGVVAGCVGVLSAGFGALSFFEHPTSATTMSIDVNRILRW